MDFVSLFLLSWFAAVLLFHERPLALLIASSFKEILDSCRVWRAVAGLQYAARMGKFLTCLQATPPFSLLPQLQCS